MKIKVPSLAFAALLFAGLPLASSSAQIGISVAIAPPEIPVYEQPPCPVEGYLWTPGYWSYAEDDYYWVPGVWVPPPRIGVLWTPGYWGYDGSRYAFNEGYWGPSVGFYGGIDYGYGYGGQGYYGGGWSGNVFRYNTAVTRVNTTVIRNTYVNREVVRNNTGTRASFNGPGGSTAKPTTQELAAAKAEHVPPTPQQRSSVEAAKNNPDLRAAKNQGKPKAEAINALDRNNGTQPATAAAGGRAGVGKQAGAGKATGAAAQRANGNSAFGRKQGDATTRTKGSQNNAYGKAQSAGAHSSRAAAAPRAPQTERSRPNRESVRMASAPRAQAVSHRPQGASVRQVGPAAKGRAPAGSPQSGNKKKKPADGKPGGG